MGSRQPEESGGGRDERRREKNGKNGFWRARHISALLFSRRAHRRARESAGEGNGARAHLEEVETPLQADHTLAGDRRGVKLEVRGEGSGRGQRAEAREGSSVVNSFYARTAVDRGSPRSGS